MNGRNYYCILSLFDCPAVRCGSCGELRWNGAYTEKSSGSWVLYGHSIYFTDRLLADLGHGYDDKNISAAFPFTGGYFYRRVLKAPLVDFTNQYVRLLPVLPASPLVWHCCGSRF